MTANRVETGTKEERMTIKSKRGGGVKEYYRAFQGEGGSSKSYRDTPLPPR